MLVADLIKNHPNSGNPAFDIEKLIIHEMEKSMVSFQKCSILKPFITRHTSNEFLLFFNEHARIREALFHHDSITSISSIDLHIVSLTKLRIEKSHKSKSKDLQSKKWWI